MLEASVDFAYVVAQKMY